MNNFTITPISTGLVITATFARSDGTPDVGYSSPINWTVDLPNLVSLFAGGGGMTANQVKVAPVLPAANAGGVATVTAHALNENGVAIQSSYTVTIAVNPNPATGFTFA